LLKENVFCRHCSTQHRTKISINIHHSNNLKHMYLAVGEIKVRIIVHNKCYHALSHILKKRCITHPLRVCLYKITGSIVTSGPESWNTTERVLMTWQSKMLGKINGTIYGNGF